MPWSVPSGVISALALTRRYRSLRHVNLLWIRVERSVPAWTRSWSGAKRGKHSGLKQRQRTTFEDAFRRYFEEKVRGELKNAKHVKQWQSTLQTYAFPVVGEKEVADIVVEDVLSVLRPIWATKNETALRVRQRMEAVLDWSKGMELRDGENPARWKGNLRQLLPSPNKVQKETCPVLASGGLGLG